MYIFRVSVCAYWVCFRIGYPELTVKNNCWGTIPKFWTKPSFVDSSEICRSTVPLNIPT